MAIMYLVKGSSISKDKIYRALYVRLVEVVGSLVVKKRILWTQNSNLVKDVPVPGYPQRHPLHSYISRACHHRILAKKNKHFKIPISESEKKEYSTEHACLVKIYDDAMFICTSNVTALAQK